jgi:glutaredoxin-like YruB-family protein
MKIIIYSTSVCPWCDVAKQFLREHNIKFEEINVAEDPKAAQEMIEKSKQRSVPVLDIDGKIIVGFDKEAIKKALGLK